MSEANLRKTHDDFASNMAKLADLQKQLVGCYIEKDGNYDLSGYFSNISDIMSQISSCAMEDPEELYKRQLELATEYTKIWSNAWSRYIGEEKKPLYPVNEKDRRFKDDSWDKDLTLDVIKQSYSLGSSWLKKLVHDIKGVDKHTAKKFDFYTKQFLDAISPSNFAITNPEVIKETLNSNGENLVKGMKNFISDFKKNEHFLSVSTTDKNFFKLGKDLASTKGKVVYKNELMELIQYEPTCKRIYKTPILLIPAWINRYYILDLSPKNSMVKWMLDNGYNVFIISWVNPDKNLAHKSFEDYMLQGPLEALDAIEKATGERNITALGYCLGGTLLSATMAYMKAKKDNRIKAATLVTTMVDFSDVGDMSVFIDEEQISQTEENMKKIGFLEGAEMAAVFSLLRANEMIWSSAVNNYLLGKSPLPFDILYWNADATRLPAKMHSYYLRNMYLNNLLKEPNALTLAGEKIDVTKITTPVYLLSTQQDHIAPWKTTFATMNLFSGKKRFVLSESGHVAGVINPPSKKKYGYFTNSDSKVKTPNQWLEKAKEHEGSWWLDWDKWNKQYSGERINVSKVGSGKIKPLYDAPGKYVLEP